MIGRTGISKKISKQKANLPHRDHPYCTAQWPHVGAGEEEETSNEETQDPCSR